MLKRIRETEVNGQKWVLGLCGGVQPYCWYAEIPNYTAQDRKDGLVYRRGFATKEKAEQWFRGEVLRA